MTAARVERLLIEAMAKHLPPSAASLRLVDIGGRAGAVFAEARADLDIVLTPGRADTWQLPQNSIDAVVAYDCQPDNLLLASALSALRPGGRLIMLDPRGKPDETLVKLLESGGFTRILVETGAESPKPTGVLMRGEKPHVEAHTVDRIKEVAARDTPQRRAGRYVHLLIQQTPNKPAWKLKKDEALDWQAVAVAGDNETVLLAFSSLPKAVEFMQPAVLAGRILDVNKVAKFAWAVVQALPYPIMLNPSDEIFDTQAPVFVQVDPTAAEEPDE
ncbi:MAG: hypothetical protein ABI690_07880 [Chloroflexota bacterium]